MAASDIRSVSSVTEARPAWRIRARDDAIRSMVSQAKKKRLAGSRCEMRETAKRFVLIRVDASCSPNLFYRNGV
jgi:hypothetical protein